jgi:hypothetical protein
MSLRHSLGSVFVAICVLLPGGLVYLLVLLATWVQLGTQGYVSFDLVGVSLADRYYAREDREVRLVGMMHVGEGDVYRDLVASFISPSTVVLAEGVSDEQGLLEVPLSYESAARAIGLEQQGELVEYLAESRDGELAEWPVVRHADVDLSTFDPTTLEWLAWSATVWSSSSPIAALAQLQRRLSAGGDIWTVVSGDILDRRNAHLLMEIESALEEFQRVIVPWGALHLPVIEASLVEQGFERTDSQLRRFVSWRTVAAALL